MSGGGRAASASPAASSAAREEERLLQPGGIHPRSDVGQISRRRVTAGALAFAVEIGGAGPGVASKNVLNLKRGAQRIVDLLMEGVREILNLRLSELRRWRRLRGMAFFEERPDG